MCLSATAFVAAALETAFKLVRSHFRSLACLEVLRPVLNEVDLTAYATTWCSEAAIAEPPKPNLSLLIYSRKLPLSGLDRFWLVLC